MSCHSSVGLGRIALESVAEIEWNGVAGIVWNRNEASRKQNGT